MKNIKKLISSIILAFVLFISFIGLFSCQSKIYNISLNVEGNIYETITTNDTNLTNAPDKNGYTFNGWYLDNEVWQSPFSANMIASVTEDTTIYAKYDLITYTITYQNTRDAINTNVTTYNVESETFTLADIEASGFVFNGWYNGDALVTSIQKGTIGNLTLNASWNDNDLNITYNEDKLLIKTTDVISASLFEATCTNINNEAVTLTATTSDELVAGKTINVTLTAIDNGYTESLNLKVKVYGTPTVTSNAINYLYKDSDLSLLFNGLDSFNEKAKVTYTIKNGNMETPGAITFEATSTDLAGNSLTEEFTYTVIDDLIQDKFLVNEEGNCITGLKPSEVSTLADTDTLTNLVIPYAINSKLITEIGKEAFQNNTTIKSVTLPLSIKILNDKAFYRCYNLEEINLVDGLTFIGKNCFDENKLKSIYIPDSVTSIEYGAFMHNKSLETLRVSNNLSFLGEYAFSYCTSLTSVNIPLSLSGIPSRCFYSCSALKDIVIPNNISVIENYAFTDCLLLENVTIPEGFFRFGLDAFLNTAWEKNLRNEAEDDIIYLNNLAYLYIGGTTPGYNTITIKEGTTVIASNAFFGSKWLESIVIPESVEVIGDSVFYGCSNLASITLNDSVNYIGEYALKNCESLTSIALPENVTELSKQLFYGCELLSNVTVSENLTTIGQSAFERCYALVSIDIHSNVLSIGSYAFKNCNILENITLSETIKTIGEQAFYRCFKLATINLPDSIESIEVNAFEYCSVLSSIVLPKNLTVINKYTFANCPLLASVTFNEGLTHINEFAFNRAYALDNLVFPSSLEFIGESAFQLNYSLKSVTLPEKITELSYKAFAYCPTLASVTLNEGLTIIGGLAFDECRALTSIVFPTTLEVIETKAFHECDLLTSITIPRSVGSIGELAFESCDILETIEITDNTLVIGKDAFSNTLWSNNQTADEYGVIYLGKIAYDFIDTTLEDASINIILKDDTLAIASNAFENITKPLTITIPESLKVINSNAFKGSTGLTQIFIPKTVLEVKDTIFALLEETITVYLETEAIPTTWSTDWAKDISTENIIFNSTGITEETE